MNNEPVDHDLGKLFSTYGLITAQRILSKYQISLSQDELLMVIRNPFCFYHRLLRVPIKNVLNGIILEQANDYQVYAQKLFIDYLLSGECAKSELSQGALTREALEDERQRLLALGDNFQKKQFEQNALIANSQITLIHVTKEWNTSLETAIKLFSKALKSSNIDAKKSTLKQAINFAMIHSDFNSSVLQSNKYFVIEKVNEILKHSLSLDLKDRLIGNLEKLITTSIDFEEKIKPYVDEIKEMAEQSRSYRTQFYEAILRINELLKLLPDYKINIEKDIVNREPLHFDKNIGI